MGKIFYVVPGETYSRLISDNELTLQNDEHIGVESNISAQNFPLIFINQNSSLMHKIHMLHCVVQEFNLMKREGETPIFSDGSSEFPTILALIRELF